MGVFTVAEMNPDLSVVGDVGVDSYPHVSGMHINTGDASFIDNDRDQPSNLMQAITVQIAGHDVLGEDQLTPVAAEILNALQANSK